MKFSSIIIGVATSGCVLLASNGVLADFKAERVAACNGVCHHGGHKNTWGGKVAQAVKDAKCLYFNPENNAYDCFTPLPNGKCPFPLNPAMKQWDCRDIVVDEVVVGADAKDAAPTAKSSLRREDKVTYADLRTAACNGQCHHGGRDNPHGGAELLDVGGAFCLYYDPNHKEYNCFAPLLNGKCPFPVDPWKQQWDCREGAQHFDSKGQPVIVS